MRPTTAARFLDDEGYGRALTLLPRDVRGSRVRTLADTASALATGGARTLVLDPAAVSVDSCAELTACAHNAGARVLLFVPPGSDCASRLLACAAARPTEVLFWDASDERFVFGRAVHPDTDPAAVALLLHVTATSLGKLRPEVARAALPCFGWERVPTPAQFIRTCGASRSTVERVFAAAGVPRIGKFLDGVRLARVWDLLPAERSLAELADRAGYNSPNTLNDHCRRLAWCSVRKLRRDLTADEFVRRIAAAIVGPRTRW